MKAGLIEFSMWRSSKKRSMCCMCLRNAHRKPRGVISSSARTAMPISSDGEGRKVYDTRDRDERERKYLPGSGVFGRAIGRTHSQKQFTASSSGHDSAPRVEAGGGSHASR